MRRVRFDEGDLNVIFKGFMENGGFLREDEEILGYEYKTRKIKKGGDYYKDGVTDPDYPAEGVEVVQWIKVLVGKKKVKAREEPPEEDSEESVG